MTTPDIFLSYNREDSAVARAFAEGLEREGFSVWWDQTLRSGEAYDEVTEAALKSAKAVVVLWSPRSVVSRWVRAEATIADRNKTLVPVMIEPCERPIMFELTQTAELGHWTGDAGDRAWQGFLGDVRGFVGREAAAPAPTAPAPTPEPTPGKPGERGGAPSLAVMPFANRSGLTEDEVFAIGMVEDLIDAISLSQDVRVLSSGSTAKWAGKPTDLREVGRELRVRYVLEGNVRRSGANLRVTVQLAEAESGAIQWTQKFERPISELADLQEDLITELAVQLGATVTNLEMGRALSKPTDLTAWEALARAYSAYRQFTPEAIDRAITEATRATEIAPDYGAAQAFLAAALALRYFSSGVENPAEVARIREIANRALVLAPNDVPALCRIADALAFTGHPSEALQHTARALQISPNTGLAHHYRGRAFGMLDRPEEALMHFDTAARLMPGWHIMWAIHVWVGIVHVTTEDWPKAEMALDDCIALNPTFGGTYVLKALTCLHLDRRTEACQLIRNSASHGQSLATAEFNFRHMMMSSARLDRRIAELRELWAEAEAGA